MPLDVVMHDARWSALDLTTLANRAFAVSLVLLNLDPDICDAALLACDDVRITTLNTEFREKTTSTNVLSWPTADLSPETAGAPPLSPRPDGIGEIALGDIAIAYDTCARESYQAGKSLHDHATHLIVHGLLHLLGYDHICDRDATLMEQTEIKILGMLGIDDPYRVD